MHSCIPLDVIGDSRCIAVVFTRHRENCFGKLHAVTLPPPVLLPLLLPSVPSSFLFPSPDPISSSFSKRAIDARNPISENEGSRDPADLHSAFVEVSGNYFFLGNYTQWDTVTSTVCCTTVLIYKLLVLPSDAHTNL